MPSPFDLDAWKRDTALPEGAPTALLALRADIESRVLPKEQATVAERLGKPVAILIDWRSFVADPTAAGKLEHKGIGGARSALCLLAGDRAAADAVRAAVDRVLLRHHPQPRPEASLIDGTLEVWFSPKEPTPPAGGNRFFQTADLQAFLREELDLDAGPAIQRMRDVTVADLNRAIHDRAQWLINLEVDLDAIRRAFRGQACVEALRRLDSVLLNLMPLLSDTDRLFPLDDRVAAFRVEHVPTPAQRAVLARPGVVVYQVCLGSDEGKHWDTDLQRILPGVVAGMPLLAGLAPPPPRPAWDDPAATAAQLHAEHDAVAAPPLVDAIQDALDHASAVDVDWDSVGMDAAAARGMGVWGLPRVLGAFRLMLLDEQQRGDLRSRVREVRIRNIASAPPATPPVDPPAMPAKPAKRVSLEEGQLLIDIQPALGEAGCFYECDLRDALVLALDSRVTPEIKGLIDRAAVWEDRLRRELGLPIRYDIDFASFRHAEDGVTLAGFHILREMGIDAIHYLVADLCAKDAKFAEMVRGRVRTLRLVHGRDASDKGVAHAGSALVLRLFVQEGHDGYLHGKALERAVRAAVSQMTDIAVDESGTDAR